MKSANMKCKGQVYSVGNYLMTGKVLGKGHFARVEEATHRIIGKKVAIKIIDLTCIKEEYARRNLHREPRVMAKLRHPCIAALYETMMHGPRLYVVMEAAGGGDLCAHVLSARGATRGLPEPRARHLAAQLVSAVKHMHARGVVHRDLKMENIMLDTSKQFIKIVDFGLSNMWTSGGALRTPCGSLEYAAPELFVDGRRYGPEVDLWSIGVIVYGMVTGGLPFTGAETSESRSRPQLRAAISRGFTRKQKAALACASTECKVFIQQLLEPNVESRMKIDEASRHRWIKKPGMRMKTHPLVALESKINNELYRQIAELNGQTVIEVLEQIKSDPFGTLAGMFNIKTHLLQLHSLTNEPLWSSTTPEPRPVSPPEYKMKYEVDRFGTPASNSKHNLIPNKPTMNETVQRMVQKLTSPICNGMKPQIPNGIKPNGVYKSTTTAPQTRSTLQQTTKETLQKTIKTQTSHTTNGFRTLMQPPKVNEIKTEYEKTNQSMPSPSLALVKRTYLKKPVYKICDSGDCSISTRLPCIDEHSNSDLNAKKNLKYVTMRNNSNNVVNDRTLRLNSCPNKTGDKRADFYRRAGDGMACWQTSGVPAPSPAARILLQKHSTTIKRASLGNIVSPHSSSNSQCKSERAMPVGWYTTRSKDVPLQRFRRVTPLK